MEDDGTPTGLHPAHQNLAGLPGMVAAKTSPSLAVAVNEFEFLNIRVAQIVVPQSRTEVSTTAGVYLHLRLKQDGTPECVQMLPHDRRSRAGRFGLADVSAQSVAGERIGIVERSGRGVDKICRGMLKFGRPEPDYSCTDNNNVVLQLATVERTRFSCNWWSNRKTGKTGLRCP